MRNRIMEDKTKTSSSRELWLGMGLLAGVAFAAWLVARKRGTEDTLDHLAEVCEKVSTSLEMKLPPSRLAG